MSTSSTPSPRRDFVHAWRIAPSGSYERVLRQLVTAHVLLSALTMAARKSKSSKSDRSYGPKASAKVERAMHERKEGTLRSGGSGAKVRSRKQAIAIGLSEARAAGGKVPPAPQRKAAKKTRKTGRKTARKTSRKSKTPRKTTRKSKTARKTTRKSR